MPTIENFKRVTFLCVRCNTRSQANAPADYNLAEGTAPEPFLHEALMTLASVNHDGTGAKVPGAAGAGDICDPCLESFLQWWAAG